MCCPRQRLADKVLMTGALALVLRVSGGLIGYVMTHCAQDTLWDDSGGVLGAQVGVGWTTDPERDHLRSWDVFSRVVIPSGVGSLGARDWSSLDPGHPPEPWQQRPKSLEARDPGLGSLSLFGYGFPPSQ